MSHSTVMRLNLSFVQQEELSNCARTLALQCATKVTLFFFFKFITELNFVVFLPIRIHLIAP
jgi:hypothetical protein